MFLPINLNTTTGPQQITIYIKNKLRVLNISDDARNTFLQYKLSYGHNKGCWCPLKPRKVSTAMKDGSHALINRPPVSH